MKQVFTLTELYAHRGCYSKEMVSYCLRGKDTITLEAIILHTDMKLTEKAWFISNHTGLTPHQHELIALGCAGIAVGMYGGLPSNQLTVKVIHDALTNDASIQNAMSIAGIKNQQSAYAIYAACSRDPYDRIYSACNAVELSGNIWTKAMQDYFIRVLL